MTGPANRSVKIYGMAMFDGLVLDIFVPKGALVARYVSIARQVLGRSSNDFFSTMKIQCLLCKSDDWSICVRYAFGNEPFHRERFKFVRMQIDNIYSDHLR